MRVNLERLRYSQVLNIKSTIGDICLEIRTSALDVVVSYLHGH